MTAATITGPTLFDLLDAKIEDYDRAGAIDVWDIEPGDVLHGDVLTWGAVLGDYDEFHNATLTANRNGDIILHPHNLNLPPRRLRGEVLLLPR